MWFDKQNEDTVYLDQKKQCRPTILAVWKALPFENERFDLVVFDPPHLVYGPENKGLFKERYGGINNQTFHVDFFNAFKELFRVLKTGGFLIFKWNDHDKPVEKILALIDQKPLFGQRTSVKTRHISQTLWICFKKARAGDL